MLGAVLLYSGYKDVSLVQALMGDVPGPDEGDSQNPIAMSLARLGVGAPPGVQGPGGLAYAGAGKTVTMDGQPVAGWIAAILQQARAAGVNFRVTSGYRSPAEQARVCATGVKPCAAPGQSRHQGTTYPNGAVDVSGANALNAWLRRSPYRSQLIFAGGKDPVHFSHPEGGSY